MPPVSDIEVGAGQKIQMPQQVAVEGSSDGQRVVVGGFEHGDGLDQINADQQRPALARAARLPQERQRLVRCEVADAGPRIKQGARASADLRRQLQGSRKVETDAEQVQRRMPLLQEFQRLAQEADRDIHRHVAPHLKSAEQAGGLFAIARPKVHQGRHRTQRLRHAARLRREDRRFGARQIIFRQFGDRGEQPRTQRVVQVFGRYRRRGRG